MENQIETYLSEIGPKVVTVALQELDAQVSVFKVTYPSYDLNAFRLADIIHGIVGTIVATFLVNNVDRGLQHHVAARFIYELTGRLYQTLLSQPQFPAPEMSSGPGVVVEDTV